MNGGHDPLCFLAQFPGKAAQAVGPDACTCATIRAARADERFQMLGEFIADDVVQARARERADLRAQVEALRDGTTNRTRDWDYFSALDDVLALIDGPA